MLKCTQSRTIRPTTGPRIARVPAAARVSNEEHLSIAEGARLSRMSVSRYVRTSLRGLRVQLDSAGPEAVQQDLAEFTERWESFRTVATHLEPEELAELETLSGLYGSKERAIKRVLEHLAGSYPLPVPAGSQGGARTDAVDRAQASEASVVPKKRSPLAKLLEKQRATLNARSRG
jgi:hypothetical protein